MSGNLLAELYYYITWRHAARRQSYFYKPPDRTHQMIGALSVAMSYHSKDSINQNENDLTVTTFDTTTRPMAARLLLTNGAGTSRYLTSLQIYGKPIYRFAGEEGYLHDKFRDTERIMKDGPVKVEIGNDYICSATQCAMIADYWWKFNGELKHEYSVELDGAWYHIEKGEWYTLRLGGPSQAEYIDSIVQCISCVVERGGGEQSRSMIVFREVQENWKFDSNARSRTRVRGGWAGGSSQGVITIGAVDGPGNPDILCDGVDDQIDFARAIDQVANGGGAKILVLPGSYHIASAVNVISELEMELATGAVFYRDYVGPIFRAVGTVNTVLTNIWMHGGGVLKDGTANGRSSQYLLMASYNEKLRIDDVVFEGASWYMAGFSECSNLYLKGVVGRDFETTGDGNAAIFVGANTAGAIEGGDFYHSADYVSSGLTAQGIELSYAGRMRISNCRFHNLKGLGYRVGISSYQSDELIVDNCDFDDLVSGDDRVAGVFIEVGYVAVQNCRFDGVMGYGITDEKRGCGVVVAEGSYCQIRTNNFKDCGIGIYISAGSTNEMIYNTMLDCGQFVLDGGADAGSSRPALLDELAGTVSSCVVSNSTTIAYSGDNCWRMRKTVGSGTTASLWICDGVGTADMHGLSTNTTYIFEAQVYASTQTTIPYASGVLLTFDHYSGGAWVVAASASVETKDAWNALRLEATIPAGAAAVRMGVQLAGATTTNASIYFDDLRIGVLGKKRVMENDYVDAGTGTLIKVS